MKKSVLIIEDDENIAKAEELILMSDFNVHIAKDGEEGLKKAEEIKPDLIVLDLMLPNIGGIEVCKKIREHEQLKDTKIVMVTAKDQRKDELKGMGTGADDYIMKPFEADELIHVINQVLNK